MPWSLDHRVIRNLPQNDVGCLEPVVDGGTAISDAGAKGALVHGVRIAQVGDTVGFVGVGQMGRRMAANLITVGFDVVIHDLRPQVSKDPLLHGARWGRTPKEAADASTITITSLPGPQEVAQAVLGQHGVIDGLDAGDIYIDMSTNTPDCIRVIAHAVSEKGAHAIDAPVAGGIRGARRGTLTIMAGGPEPVFEACRPLLEAMGNYVVRMGDVGTGHATKLVNNMMSILNALAAMEAMVFGTRYGVDPQELLGVVEAGTGGSYALNLFRYVIFKGNFEPAKFSLALAAKDLQLSLGCALNWGLTMSLVASASSLLDGALLQGLGGKDWSSYVTLLEREAGINLRAV